MKTPLIQVENLVARYGETVILDKVSFCVYTGEILVILGGSGCGKSTLLRHMIGLNRPHSGKMLIDGIDISSCEASAFQQTLKKIGILFQASALFGSMTVGENVALPITEYADLPENVVQDLVRMKLRQVDLGGTENFMPHELSGGMKKRAGLARALALNPKILFLDEPSAGLDPVTAAEIDELLLQINRSSNTTLVLVTHDLQSIFKVAQRVIMLDKNTKGIIAQGTPEQLRDHDKHPVVRSFFNRKPPPKGHQGI